MTGFANARIPYGNFKRSNDLNKASIATTITSEDSCSFNVLWSVLEFMRPVMICLKNTDKYCICNEVSSVCSFTTALESHSNCDVYSFTTALENYDNTDVPEFIYIR